MNSEDSPCLGWLVPQRSAVTQLPGRAWKHPLSCVAPKERRSPAARTGARVGFAAGSFASLGLPSTSVLSLTCHLHPFSLSGVPPWPLHGLLCRVHAQWCQGPPHTAVLPGRSNGTPQSKGLCPGPRPALPTCSWGGSGKACFLSWNTSVITTP